MTIEFVHPTGFKTCVLPCKSGFLARQLNTPHGFADLRRSPRRRANE